MAEVLISTCGDADEYPVQGHKNAMQAIQLLASVYSRLDQTIDLFFDLVERFCAQSCSRDPTRHSACVTRTIQDYDEMLLKLISKHWHASGPEGSWDVIRPMQRIKDLRHIYVPSEGSKRQLILGRARRKAAMSHLFSESYQALRTVEKQRRRGPPRSPMTSGFRDSHSALSQWSGSTTSPVASAAHPSPPQRYALPEEEEALSTPVPSQDDTPDMYELDAGWLAESSVPTQEEDDALAEYEAREADWPLAKTTAYVSGECALCITSAFHHMHTNATRLAAELPPFAHKYEHAYHRRHGTFDSIPTFRIAAAA